MPKVSWDGKPENVGRHVREHRLSRGWTQATLSHESSVSLRTVKGVERGAAATLTTIGRLAKALGISIVELLGEGSPSRSTDEFPRFLLQQVFPVAIDPRIEQLAREGAFADMHRDYDLAVTKFKSAEKLDDSLEVQALLIVKWASSLDNAGKSDEALRELQPLLVNARFRELRPQISNWVRYHVAIAKRRLYEKRGIEREQDLGEAEKTFKELAKGDDAAQRVAAIHQLGVVFWVRSVQTNSSEHRNKAKRFFKNAAREWRKANNFREGYALRRLADIAEVEEGFHRAHEILLDALETFTRFEAERYRRETRARLRDLFERASARRSA